MTNTHQIPYKKNFDKSWAKCQVKAKFCQDTYFKKWKNYFKKIYKKLNTPEEGGAQLWIFILGFTDELEKQIFIEKTVEVGQ